MADVDPRGSGLYHKETKKAQVKRICLSLGGIIFAMIVFFVVFNNPYKEENNASELSLMPLGVGEMKGVVNQIRLLETSLQIRKTELSNLRTLYKDSTGEEFSQYDALEMTPQEKQDLQAEIGDEENIQLKHLISKIREKNQEILRLQNQIQMAENKLPQPHVVTEGESHFKIAMNFLMDKKGLDEVEALLLVEKSGLWDYLPPGFKVWNSLSGQEFGSFVTQGSASVSPNFLRYLEKKEMEEAEFERDKFLEEMDALKKTRHRYRRQLGRLKEEKTHLQDRVEELRKINNTLQRESNSLFYKLDLRENLLRERVIKRGLFTKSQLQRFPAGTFGLYIDLRESKEIVVLADHFSIRKIKKLTLFPQTFREGIDYEKVINVYGDKAIITILKPDKFKTKRIVLAIN